MRPLTFLFPLLSGALMWAGYQVSHWRAQAAPLVPPEVLAAAGSDGPFIGATESSDGERGYRLSSLSVFSNVALHVKDNYVEPERVQPKEMLVAALREVERQIAEVLVQDLGNGNLRVSVMEQEKVVYIDDVESLWEINLKLREVFRFLEQTLPPQKDLRAIEYAAVNGALSTLDPHSVLLKPEAFAEMKTSTKGEFGGLGIVISVRDAKLTIISPLDGTPAARAGLKTGDVISRIGEVSTVSMPIEEAVKMLRGPEGSKVSIWVDRKGWTESKKYSLVRERIKIESVDAKLLSDNVGYIKIKNFQQNTGKDLSTRLEDLQKQAGGKLKGLVLDLRNNPGGLLEQAIQVSDKFLTSGDIVTTVGYGNKLREPKRARWSGTESELPLAVLVNQGSASASEIVAGALKNLDRAIIIGERTFGKGSVQVLYDFADNSALKLTIAQYLTPGGISIQNEGVAPDIALNAAWLEQKGVRLFYEPEGHRERNLDKHLDKASPETLAQAQPAYHLTYVMENTAEAPEPEPAEEAPEENLPIEEDYPTRFARELLLSVGAPSRSRMIISGKNFVETRAKAEEARLVEQMQKLGVDWRPRPPTEAPTTSPKLELQLTVNDNAPHISAGEAVKVVATVKNVGQTPAYRLRGILSSEHPSFVGRELMYGYLAPGETKSWTVDTKVSKDSASRSDLLAFKLATADGPVADELVLAVVTRQVAHPQISYSYLIDDTKRGDGDGVLEAGEGVDFVILVTNTGAGAADDVALRLKSGAEEDLFLERGRIVLGPLAAGETKPARLAFRLPKTLTKETLPLELTAYDSGTGVWLEDEITLVAKKFGSEKAQNRKLGLVARRDVSLFSGADASRVIGQIKKGTKVSSDRRLGEYYWLDLGNDISGWAKAADFTVGVRPKTAPTVAYLPQRKPPTITFANEVAGSVLAEDTVELKGAVEAPSLRDMYVVVNDQKVFFATANAPKTPNETIQLPFSVQLPLKEGMNKVMVVGRVDERVVTYKPLYVSRRALPASAVAERTDPAAEPRTPPR